jgi:hypothetical protein
MLTQRVIFLYNQEIIRRWNIDEYF